MPLAEGAMLGLALRFEVQVSGYDLGSWSTCKGLSVSYRHEKITELGQHSWTVYVPGRLEYSPVTLERAMAAGDWATTKKWLESMVAPSGESTASIVLRDAHLGEVARWTLRNAMPSAWKGPSLDANGNRVATETLELVHEGFLDD